MITMQIYIYCVSIVDTDQIFWKILPHKLLHVSTSNNLYW